MTGPCPCSRGGGSYELTTRLAKPPSMNGVLNPRSAETVSVTWRTVRASSTELKVPSSLKLTRAPTARTICTAGSVQCSGTIRVWTEPPGSYRYDPAVCGSSGYSTYCQRPESVQISTG